MLRDPWQKQKEKSGEKRGAVRVREPSELKKQSPN